MKLSRIIEKTLDKLDTNNDEHWLVDGRPNPQVVAAESKNVAVNSLTIAEYAPDYRRDNRVLFNSKKETVDTVVDFSFEEPSATVEEKPQENGQELTIEQIDFLLKEKQGRIDTLRGYINEAQQTIEKIISETDVLLYKKEELEKQNPVSLEEMERKRYLHSKQQERDRIVALANQIKSIK